MRNATVIFSDGWLRRFFARRRQMEKMRSGVGGCESQVTSDLWREAAGVETVTSRLHAATHTHIKLSSETLQQVACTVQPFQPEWNCVRFSPVYITVCARQRKCALDFISIAPAVKISSDGVIKWREGWWHTHIRPRETLIKHTPDNLTHIYAEEFITVSMKQHFTSVLWWIFF